MPSRIRWSLPLFAALVLAASPARADEGGAVHHSMREGHRLDVGSAGKPADVRRSLFIGMNDHFEFVPAKLTIKPGETVRLVVRNTGAVDHELFLGTAREIAAHAELMRRDPKAHHHEPQQVLVPPGEVRELLWHFDRPGTFVFGCLLPGHYEAGMKGTIVVR